MTESPVLHRLSVEPRAVDCPSGPPKRYDHCVEFWKILGAHQWRSFRLSDRVVDTKSDQRAPLGKFYR